MVHCLESLCYLLCVLSHPFHRCQTSTRIIDLEFHIPKFFYDCCVNASYRGGKSNRMLYVAGWLRISSNNVPRTAAMARAEVDASTLEPA